MELCGHRPTNKPQSVLFSKYYYTTCLVGNQQKSNGSRRRFSTVPGWDGWQERLVPDVGNSYCWRKGTVPDFTKVIDFVCPGAI